MYFTHLKPTPNFMVFDQFNPVTFSIYDYNNNILIRKSH